MPGLLRRRLLAFALVAPVLVAVSAAAAPVREDVGDELEKNLTGCAGDCQKTQRACNKACEDDNAQCRKPCGCTDKPEACSAAQRSCHGQCTNRFMGCAHACQREANKCRKKCGK